MVYRSEDTISCNQSESSLNNTRSNENSNLEETSEVQPRSSEIEMEKEADNASPLTGHVQNATPNISTNRQSAPKSPERMQISDIRTLNELNENTSSSGVIDARQAIVRGESVGDHVTPLRGSYYRTVHVQQSERSESNTSNVRNSSNVEVPAQSLVRTGRGRGRVKTGDVGTVRIRNVSKNHHTAIIRNKQFFIQICFYVS